MMNTGRGQGATIGRTSGSVMSGGGESPPAPPAPKATRNMEWINLDRVK